MSFYEVVGVCLEKMGESPTENLGDKLYSKELYYELSFPRSLSPKVVVGERESMFCIINLHTKEDFYGYILPKKRDAV